MTLRGTILSEVVDTVIATLTTENLLPTSRHRVALVAETYVGQNQKFGRPGTVTATETLVQPLNLDLKTQYDKTPGMQVKLGDAKIRISQTTTKATLEDSKYISIATEQQVDLDIDTIDWSSGTSVVLAFNSSPDFSQVAVGWLLKISSSTNSTNDGTYSITAIDDTLKTLTITNANRTDATDDEVTDATGTAILYSKPIRFTYDNASGIVDEGTGFFWTIFLQRQHQS